MIEHNAARPLRPLLAIFAFACMVRAAVPVGAQQVPPPPSPQAAPSAAIIHRVQGANERIEMIVSTSRILTLDQKIPQAQVNNPDILELVPISPTQVQISARKTGVTQVNLWTEDKRVSTIDVTVVGDARELAAVLRSQFPKASLNVVPVGSSVLISGYVDQQDAIGRIIQVAQEYYPKVINNMTASGVQQVLLHVKVMEVSRTKLRSMGFDFSQMSNGVNSFVSGAGGILVAGTGAISGNAAPTVSFNIVQGGSSFFGVLEALRNDKLAKVLSEPNLVTVSGRPAYFIVGGEIGYQLNGGITGPTVEFKEYGTRVDMVPIVMGNGRIRLEVRPRVSEKDEANSVGGIPALKTREVDTGVDMRAGQTLAIAGLVQQRIESSNRGLPWISEVPYLGMPFRKVQEEINEVELLITVTPELVEAMDAHQVPPCGPGMQTTIPNDCELFFKGHLEVPNCCPGCNGAGCSACGGHGVPGAVQGPDGMWMRQSRPAGTSQPGARSAALAGDGAGFAAVSDPQIQQSSQSPSNSNVRAVALPANNRNGEPSFIGPIGYDVVN
jgi:pilus assembly protein CpaC